MKKISVVIPSYNSKDTISAVLRGLEENVVLPEEIIVVDSSDDGTNLLIKNKFPFVKLFHYKNRLLPGAARNIGWKNSVGDIIAFLDADCIPDSQWVSTIINAHNSYRYVAGITGSFEVANPHDIWGLIVFAAELGASLPGRQISNSRLAPSGNTSYKRFALETTGGFIEDMFCEDTVLANKLKSIGYQILYMPDIRVQHINREGYEAFKNAFIRSGYYSALVRKKYNLKGSFFSKIPFFIPLLIPYRVLNIYYQNYIGKNLYYSRLVKAFPLVLYGMIIWAISFWRGAMSNA